MKSTTSNIIKSDRIVIKKLLTTLSYCIIAINKLLQMKDDVRTTAKFLPIRQIHSIIYTNKSKINIQNRSFTKITWKRRYGESVEQLSHLDNRTFYQCSQLDIDFIIEATIQGNLSLKNNQPTIQEFGPIESQKQQSFLMQNQYNSQVLTQSKIYPCLLTVYSNQIQVKPKSSPNQLFYQIPMQDIGSCYVINPSTRTIIFPTVYQRITVLKLFNQILLTKGNYCQNNDSLKIRIINQSDFRSILLKLNSIKIEKYRRGSQISTYMNKKKPKPSIISTEAKKSTSDIRQDSEDSFRIIKKSWISPPLKNMNASELIITKPNNLNQDYDNDDKTSLQGQINYFSQFQNLIYSDQQKGQTLLLSQSFEELQNKNRSQKDIQKLQYIQRKKQLQCKNKENSIKTKLIEVLKQKKRLRQANNRLKQQIEKLSTGWQGVEYVSIQYLQNQKRQLLTELQSLTRRNCKTSLAPNSKINSPKHHLTLTKYKSDKQVISLFD